MLNKVGLNSRRFTEDVEFLKSEVQTDEYGQTTDTMVSLGIFPAEVKKLNQYRQLQYFDRQKVTGVEIVTRVHDVPDVILWKGKRIIIKSVIDSRVDLRMIGSYAD